MSYVYFQYFANTNYFAINNLMHVYFILFEEYLQGRYLEVGLWSQNVSAYALLLNTANLFSSRNKITYLP